MKKYLIILFILGSALVANAQKYRFETTGFSTSYKDKKGDWKDWSKNQPTKLIIELDRDKSRFVVYSEAIQLFNIYKYEEKVETKDGSILKYFAVDNQGIPTIITVETFNGSAIKNMYIANDETMILYEIIYKGEK